MTGDPRDRLYVVAGVPERRVRFLEWVHQQPRLLILVVLALVGQRLLGEPFDQDIQGLLKHLPPIFLQCKAVAFRLHGHYAATYPQVQSALAQVVQHADFVQQPERVVEGQQVDQGTQPYVLSALAGGSQEDARRGSDAEGSDVVLGQVIAIEACSVSILQHLQTLFVRFAVRMVVLFNPVEKPEPDIRLAC